MGNRNPVRPGVTPVAADTYPFFLIMGLVALQAARDAGMGDDALQEKNTGKDRQKLKTKAQFSPLKNMATTVNTKIAKKIMSVRILISN